MSTCKILFALCVAGLAAPVGAQSTGAGPLRVGALVGVNSATFGGSDADSPDRLVGLVIGLTLTKPLSRNVSFRPELLFSQKGAKESFTDVDGSGNVKVKLAYIDIPLLFQWEGGSSTSAAPQLYAGPSVSFKVSCKANASFQGVEASTDCSNDTGEGAADVKSLDYGAIVGGGVAFPLGNMRASVGARYQHGLADLSSDANIKNRVITVYGTLELLRK